MRRKIATVLATVMTAVVLLMRVLLTPLMQDSETGQFHLSYWVIAVMALTVVAILILVLSDRRPVGVAARPMVLPVSMVSVAAGAVLVVSTLFDLYIWVTTKQTPAPNAYVIGKFDAVLLVLTLAFGLLGGAFLVRIGFHWAAQGRMRRGVFALWALAPSLWVWMRLARYEMSYASATDVTESFYDFVMLIFTLLFLFTFARYVSGVNSGRSPRAVLAFALCTALFSLSGTLTRLAMYLMQDSMAYTSSELAGFSDFMIGLFALIFAYSLAFPGGSVEEETLPAEGETPAPANEGVPVPASDVPPAFSSEEKEEDAMDIDSLINEIQQGKGTDSENDSRH